MRLHGLLYRRWMVKHHITQRMPRPSPSLPPSSRVPAHRTQTSYHATSKCKNTHYNPRKGGAMPRPNRTRYKLHLHLCLVPTNHKAHTASHDVLYASRPHVIHPSYYTTPRTTYLSPRPIVLPRGVPHWETSESTNYRRLRQISNTHTHTAKHATFT